MDDPVSLVEKHGVVLEGGRGPVPSLAEAIAGEPIHGSWWGHKKGKSIFWASRAVRDSDDILVCRLVGGKITYVHRRLWPALVRLAKLIDKNSIAAVSLQVWQLMMNLFSAEVPMLMTPMRHRRGSYADDASAPLRHSRHRCTLVGSAQPVQRIPLRRPQVLLEYSEQHL